MKYGANTKVKNDRTSLSSFLLVFLNILILFTIVRGYLSSPPEYGPDYSFLYPVWLRAINGTVCIALILFLLIGWRRDAKIVNRSLDALAMPQRPIQKDVIPSWLLFLITMLNLVYPLVRLLIY